MHINVNRKINAKPAGTEYSGDNFSIFVPNRPDSPIQVTGKGSNSELSELLAVLLGRVR